MDIRNYEKISDEEIDLKKFFLTLFRNKNLILKFSISGFIIGLLIAFTSKKVWQGEFQIVLESNSKELPINIDSGLADLAGLGLQGKNDTLRTEVGILKSPSVLLEVFEFIKNKKVLKGDTSLEEKGFRKWMESESVKINLIKKTSILEVSYKEKDKNLILPVLDMISKRYQEYSGKKRNRSIELAINYFEDQIPIYKNKSLESLKTVNQFAIDNDLPQTGFNILNKQSDTKNKIDKSFNGINIESNRINAANRIRLAEELLKKFDSLSQDGEQIIAFGEKIEEIYNSIGFSRLKQIDNELIKYKLAYKKKDRLIEDLILERNSLIILIKDQIRNNLINEIRLANASMKSSERPDGVLTTYAQLLSNFNKENNTLFNLEKQYRTALLEKARSEDPWELITTPTLYPKPVAPSKRLIVSLALLSSGLLGIITTLIIEKKRNLIYFSDEYDSITNCSFISEFDSLEKSYLENSLQLIADGQLSKKDDEIAFLGIGDIDVSIIDQFSKSAKIIFPSKKILLTTNFFAANKFKNIIGIIKIGISTKKDLSIILENLNLQKRNLLGLIVINNKNSSIT